LADSGPQTTFLLEDFKELTRLSEADLEPILEYTLKNWGGNQGERYLGDLQSCLQELADRTGLGRNCEAIRPGLMRMEHGRHVVFYRPKEYGIHVIRILHQSMLSGQHMRGDKE
jgi:toxin ParE1/3/4